MSLLKTYTKETSILTRYLETKVLKNLLDMEIHGTQTLPALFFDNLQKTLKKLVWKHVKFYTMTHRVTSSTTCKIFKMKYQSTSLKYKKEFKQIYSCTIFWQRCNKVFSLQKKLVASMHIADGKLIQPFYQLNTSNIG